jgi:4-hydroxybenzoate polyprenyltransferase
VLAPGKLIKAGKWWNDKAPPVFGLAYLLLAAGNHVVPLGTALIGLAAFMASFIGVAGYGHIINDLFDIEADRIAGKANAMAGRSRLSGAVIFAVLLALGLLPWLALPANRWNLLFLAAQLVLLTVYAAPPLRLKVRPWPGILSDALYAYTVPMMITWTTFGTLAGSAEASTLLLASLLPWSVCVGLTGILRHQIDDADHDLASGVTTYVTRYGLARTIWLLSCVTVPLELVFFAVMTVAIARDFWFYPLGLAVFIGWQLFQRRRHPLEHLADPRLPARERFLRACSYRPLGDFYSGWFPVVTLAALVYRSPVFLVLAAAHLMLFETGIMQIVRQVSGHVPLRFFRLGPTK